MDTLSDCEQQIGLNLNASCSGRPKSAVWDYFEYLESSNKSVCKIESCGIEVRGKYTTNLKRHLERKHAEYYRKVENIEKEKKRTLNVSSKAAKTKDIKQRTLDDLMKRNAYQKDSKKYTVLTRKLAICVATTNMANSITDNAEFREFVEELDPRYTSMPRRAALNKEIEKVFIELKQKITSLLHNARKINLTADIWTKKGMSSSFLGITAHLFNRIDHKRYNITLAVRLFQSPHTGNRILSVIKSVLSEYDIKIQDIGVILTDNGSNMVKAFSADSLLNLVTEDNDKEGSQDTEEPGDGDAATTDLTDVNSLDSDSDTNMDTKRMKTQLHGHKTTLKNLKLMREIIILLLKLLCVATLSL